MKNFNVVGAMVVLLSFSALARPENPGIVKTTLGLSAEPDCSLCHTSAQETSGNANSVFVTNLKNNGWNKDSKTLAAALAKMVTLKTDSDKDGYADDVELKAGTNPNSAASKPTGGMGGAIAKGGSISTGGVSSKGGASSKGGNTSKGGATSTGGTVIASGGSAAGGDTNGGAGGAVANGGTNTVPETNDTETGGCSAGGLGLGGLALLAVFSTRRKKASAENK